MDNNYKIGLYGMGGWSQLFFFVFLFVSGFILSSLIMTLTVNLEEIGKLASVTRLAMVIQSLGLFLIPSVAFAYLCYSQPKRFLRTSINKNWILLVLAIFLIIVIQPFINSISYYNQQIILPESMTSVETWMRQKEDSSAALIKLLFIDRSVIGLALNLLIIAVVAGVVEEFFFRGCLQQIIQKIVINKHVAIWVTAIIFSVFHFQFYGFIPRVLLGALLGYLFFWSGSIWISVIIHIVHNAINVIIMYIFYEIPPKEQIEYFSIGENPVLILLSLIFSGFILFFYIKRTRVLKYEN